MSAEKAARLKESVTGAPRSAPLEHMLTLSEVPLFRGLSRRHLRAVTRVVEVRTYRDAPVVHAGGRGDSFHIILEGQARVRTAQGHEVFLRPGDSFGELALLDGAPRDATVSAVGALTTACIQRSAFTESVLKEPGVGLSLARALVAIVRDLQSQQSVTSPQAARGRILDTVASDAEAPIEGRTSLGWLSALTQVALFRELSGRRLARVVALSELRRYRPGAVVVRAGAQGDAFHIVLDGRARVQVKGRQQPVLGAGDFFGELALLDGAPRAATVVAADELTTARIARAAFLDLLKDEPQVALGVLRGLVAIVRQLEREGRAD